MKQAIQLEIQWLEPAEAAPSAVDRTEIALLQKAKALVPSLILFAQATLAVAFAIGIIFVTSIIGG
ncbi:hypothetical protein SAMN05216354_0367 [Xylanibacter ruminicola]|uniref:Uncharacterized protein n=1 Tax=Xylanibacter ruminicola TaxID=839 RepID=A0A1H5RWJ0_XYLRU|nr:hypothetical protein [Xylanibacter ruminicola]SEF42484.1 hypothetical protein SAMN05216354_0367 [Xylanibacter ruminicola]